VKLILPDGRELPAKNIGTARVDALIELQLQTGLKSEQLNARMKASEIFVNSVLFFLTLTSAGETVKWSDVMAKSQLDFGKLELEPGDDGYKDPEAAEGDVQDPPTGPSGTPDGDESDSTRSQ
jgi:hypothetical protein